MKFSLHAVRSSVACIVCATTLLAPSSLSPAWASVPANSATSWFKLSVTGNSSSGVTVLAGFSWTSKSGTYSYGFGTDSSGANYGGLSLAGRGHSASYYGTYSQLVWNDSSSTSSTTVNYHIASSIYGDKYAGTLSSDESITGGSGSGAPAYTYRKDTDNYNDDVLTGDYTTTVLLPGYGVQITGQMSGTSSI